LNWSPVLCFIAAREHNLRNIDVSIPRDKLTVITGLSGSGKSSLVFDTIFAEGQRRYVESLSANARQLLGLIVGRIYGKVANRRSCDREKVRRDFGLPNGIPINQDQLNIFTRNQELVAGTTNDRSIY
jgi:hypothetical protein